MPARDFLNTFNFDPATFNWEQFKSALAGEIAADDDLSGAKITGLEQERNTLTESEKNLKIKLFDATIMQKGTPVTPDSSATSGGTTDSPKVAESDIFEKVS